MYRFEIWQHWYFYMYPPTQVFRYFGLLYGSAERIFWVVEGGVR